MQKLASLLESCGRSAVSSKAMEKIVTAVRGEEEKTFIGYPKFKTFLRYPDFTSNRVKDAAWNSPMKKQLHLYLPAIKEGKWRAQPGSVSDSLRSDARNRSN